jgi:pimeloyl-ACP methyl ester carboxylesterase
MSYSVAMRTRALAISLAVFAATGIALERIADRRDARKFPPPGELIDVGGHRLHARIDGSGSPTVVLEAGLGTCALYWHAVHNDVAHFTRVISYDRAGLGWSEPGPKPRDSFTICGELGALLHGAGCGGPYVLAGHSFGGIHVRTFARRYPDDVAGIVLVDASPEGQRERWPARPPLVRARQHVATLAERVAPFLARFGVTRLRRRVSPPDWGLPPQLRSIANSLEARPAALRAALDEERAVNASYAQAAPSLGDMPLIVLSALWRESQGGTDYRDFNAMWIELQSGLASLSTRGTHIIANTDKHLIPVYEPELVVRAIRQVVEIVRESNSASAIHGA